MSLVQCDREPSEDRQVNVQLDLVNPTSRVQHRIPNPTSSGYRAQMDTPLLLWVRLRWSGASSCLGNYAVGVAGLVNTMPFAVELELPVLGKVIIGTHGPSPEDCLGSFDA